MKARRQFLSSEEKRSVKAAWEMLAEKVGKCRGISMVADDYQRENFTGGEWAVGGAASIVLTLLCGIL